MRSRTTAGVLFCLTLGGVLLASKWPWKEATVKAAIEKTTGSRVTMTSFRATYFPPGCIIRGIQVINPEARGYPPLFAATSATIRTSYSEMLFRHGTINTLEITQMLFRIPPKGVSRAPHPQSSDPGGAFTIEHVEADTGVLEFLSNSQGEVATHVDVHHLRLDNATKSQPMIFHAAIRVPTPPGEVRAAGRIGPWQTSELASTPVSGTFTFQHVALAFLKGVSGDLNTEGKFSGVLGEISVQGTADVPDFRVIHSDHAVHLSSNYHVVTNATTGNTSIVNARSHWNQTTVNTTGEVIGVRHQKGKTVFLNAEVNRGRLDDLLSLFTSHPQPSMRGALALRAHIVLPPGPPKFLERLKITGDFSADGIRFTNPRLQTEVDKLERSAAGGKKSDSAPPVVLARLSGHAVAKGGTARLSHISIVSPGCNVTAEGTFDLMAKTVDLDGLLRTEGKLSDTTNGINSLVLKAISPLWRHRNSVSIIPFRITGTSSQPHFSVQLRRTTHR